MMAAMMVATMGEMMAATMAAMMEAMTEAMEAMMAVMAVTMAEMEEMVAMATRRPSTALLRAGFFPSGPTGCRGRPGKGEASSPVAENVLDHEECRPRRYESELLGDTIIFQFVFEFELASNVLQKKGDHPLCLNASESPSLNIKVFTCVNSKFGQTDLHDV